MDLFQTVVLSIVEGVTEFLPISSTGHLILTAKLLALPQTEFTKSFEITIQAGAICAVLFLYGRKLTQNPRVFRNVFFAFLPTAFLGLIFYKIIKVFLLGNLNITLLALLTGGVVLIIWENLWSQRKGGTKIEDLTPFQSVLIGVAQSVSFIPGVSRSAATILGGGVMGLSRSQAVELSFILAIPTMFAATGFDLLKNMDSFNSSEMSTILVGFTTSFVVAIIAVKWFVNFVKNYSLIPFGIYRILISIIFFLLVVY